MIGTLNSPDGGQKLTSGNGVKHSGLLGPTTKVCIVYAQTVHFLCNIFAEAFDAREGERDGRIAQAGKKKSSSQGILQAMEKNQIASHLGRQAVEKVLGSPENVWDQT